MPDELPTTTINGLEIFAAGQFNGDSYSTADLDAMIQAYDKVGFRPTIKAGHADGQEDEKVARKIFGSPALGYVSRLYRQGTKLLADVVDVPRRFANLIKAKSFHRVSSEVYWNYLANSGKKFPRVLKSIAFLGADIPALTDLQAIESLYSRNDEGSLVAYDNEKQEYHYYEIENKQESAPMPETHEHKDNQLCSSCAEAAAKAEGEKRVLNTLSDLELPKDGKIEMRYAQITENDQGQFCAYGKCFDTREEAQAHCDKYKKDMSSKVSSKTYKGGRRMDEKEVVGSTGLDPELVEKIKSEVRAEVAKEYDYRVHKAREDGKLEAEKENEELRSSIRKLEAEKRSERIEHWLKTMKADGKIAPAEESRVRALREWIPDEAEQLKHFTLRNGKTAEVEQSPAEIFESLFESRTSLFKTYSKAEAEDDGGQPLDDPSAEVDRLAKRYQAKQLADNNKVDYHKALKHVLATDPGLARRYNDLQRH